jgi:hypothetical protein
MMRTDNGSFGEELMTAEHAILRIQHLGQELLRSLDGARQGVQRVSKGFSPCIHYVNRCAEILSCAAECPNRSFGFD